MNSDKNKLLNKVKKNLHGLPPSFNTELSFVFLKINTIPETANYLNVQIPEPLDFDLMR